MAFAVRLSPVRGEAFILRRNASPPGMKKLIGIALWLTAFAIPFRYAILDTDDTVLDNGRADNITGLISFVIMITLLFVGYAVFDSAKGKAGAEGHGH